MVTYGNFTRGNLKVEVRSWYDTITDLDIVFVAEIKIEKGPKQKK
mgnify:CR=1 FL=1